MKNHFILSIMLASVFLLGCSPAEIKTDKSDTYDRVISSGKIRCGYIEWPPILQKDVNTRKFSGVGVDVINEIAARLKLTVSWDEEVGPSTVVESVKSGRVDMICMPIVVTMQRVRIADFSEPVIFSHFSPWVKKESSIAITDEMNDPKYRFVFIDGTGNMAMTERLFPNAKHLSLPELSPNSDLFLSVVTGKADAVYADTATTMMYQKTNPDKIRPVYNGKNDIYLPWAFMTARNNYQFTQMINLTLQDMKFDGTLEKILRKNGGEGHFTLDNPHLK